jgi:gamma-glutamyltranspeptidase/glutathione hydrolase
MFNFPPFKKFVPILNDFVAVSSETFSVIMNVHRSLLTVALTVIFVCGVCGAEEFGWKASGKGAAVAAGGNDAVMAGISILEKGGNAADAAVATLFALSITDYGMFAIGAEIPFLIYDVKTKKVHALSGLGGAPLDKKAIDWFYKNNIPANGSIKSAPVPAAVSLCITALKLFGTCTLEEVLQPSLKLLDQGKPVSGYIATTDWFEGLAETFGKLIETEKNTPGTREQKFQAACDRFYKGDIADQLEAYYISNGGFLRKSDLAAHVTRVEEPVKTEYRGYTVYKCGTWTQGPYLCQTLRLLEGFDLKKMGHLSADQIHVVTEALKLAMADRDEYYGDPLFADVPMKALLSDKYTKLRRPLIDMDKASDEIRPGDPVNMKAVKDPGKYLPGQGGTTTCVVADRWGNMVAATPSGNPPYSVCKELGISHGNRLRSLNTTPGHPNRIQPGKRPRITLTPTIVLKNGKPIIAISVAGGDLQDQTTLNCLLSNIEFGLMPEKAVTAARFSTGHHQGSFDPNPNRKQATGPLASLNIHKDAGEDVIEELKKRGHNAQVTSGPIAQPVMIYRNPKRKIIYAAGDPLAARHAGAID